MRRRWRAALGVAAILVVWWIESDTRASSTAPARELPKAEAPSSPRGFASRAELEEHFAKHRAEFPGATIADYLQRAQALRDASLSAAVIELRQRDGDFARYDRSSGAFVVFDARGTIRTFFRPNDGERYFRRQLTAGRR